MLGLLCYLTSALCQTAVAEDGPWRTVFDGETMNGWTTVGGRYDGHAVWQVADGALIGREGENHAGGLIYTDEVYRNCEIELETWISYPFDSGIFLRMQPEAKGAQVTLDYRPDGEVGGIYSEGWLFHNSVGKQRFLRDQWNHVRVRCVGEPMHLQVWLNGELLTDFRIPENHSEFAQSGRIGLQVHGNRDDPEDSHVKFRNIRVRSLADDAGEYFVRSDDGRLHLTESARAVGWQDLLEGGSLAAWDSAGDGSGYHLDEHGVLEFLTEGNSPHLATRQDYRNFHLRWDFKIEAMANSGVFLRAARNASNPAYSGCEVQILDDFQWEEVTQSTLEPYQFTGGLYGAVAPGHKALRPVGQWNTLEITYHENRLLTALNGKILYDVDTYSLAVTPAFKDRVRWGFLGLQRHAPREHVQGKAYAWFRNLMVRRLP